MNKSKIALILGLMCIVLTCGIVVQVRTIKGTGSTIVTVVVVAVILVLLVGYFYRELNSDKSNDDGSGNRFFQQSFISLSKITGDNDAQSVSNTKAEAKQQFVDCGRSADSGKRTVTKEVTDNHNIDCIV